MRRTPTTPVVRPLRMRGSLRAVLLLPLFMLMSLTMVAGTAMSAGAVVPLIPVAVSVVAPLLVDLAASGYSPVTEAESIKYGSATKATTGAGAIKAVPKTGYLGMVVNSVAVLGGLAYFWPGGDDAPALPDPGGQTYSGSGCGWISNTAVVGSISCTATSFTVSVLTKGGFQRVGTWIETAGTAYGDPKLTNVCGSTCSVPWSAANLIRDANADTRWTIRGENNVNPGAASAVLAEFHIAKQGSTLADPSTSSDPATVPRYIDSEITCKSASGASQVITHREGPFTFDPSQPVELPPVEDLTCPAGTWLSSGKRELASEGSAEKVALDTGYAAPPWVEQQATRFPDCFPVGSAVCQLELYKLPVGTTSPEYACGSFAVGSGNPCTDWFTDPNKSERYECRFGTYPITLAECEPLKQRYTTGTLTASPETETPAPPVGVDPTPEDTPNLGTCVPTWSELLTPWWMFKAIACGMSWAFVPSEGIGSRADRLKDRYKDRAPFAFMLPVFAMGSTVGSECPDWRVKVGNPDGVGFAFDANVVCDSEFTEAIRASRPFLTAGMIALAFWPFVRGMIYAATPILKPTPTDGK